MTFIVIADDMEEETVAELRKLGHVEYKPLDLMAALPKADVLVVRSATKVTSGLIAGAPKLRIVARAGVGLDNVDVKACQLRGIRVVNTPAASSNAVAELALGVMLCGLRNVQKAHHQMKGGIWDKKNLVGRESEGKTLGIIGYGRIGSLLARKARGIGMKVITFNPPPRHEDGFANFVDSLDQLLAQADVISVHVPATENTVNLISKENISRMKDGVFIINTSRGEVVDEDALYEACKNGKVLGAALDVYRSEPYKGKLLELDNVYFTPHLGASTKEAQARIGRELVEILRKELKG